MLFKIDSKICDWFQNSYLWVFDRTGIRVATLGMISWLIALFFDYFRRGDIGWFEIILTGWVGLYFYWRYAEQANEQFEAFNAVARFCREWTPRVYLMVFILLIETLLFDVASLFKGFFMISMNYIITIQIRKRDPKSFFEMAGRLAHQEN